MLSNGAINVGQVRNLEVGDMFAMEFLGGIISGKVSAIVHYVNDLTDEQREYMQKNRMMIPTVPFAPLGSFTSCLVFGDFVETQEQTLSQGQPLKHMYLEYNKMVAVFPKSVY